MSPDVVQLRMTLADVEPPVWRQVRVPAATTLAQLHQLIQLAFGWEDSHLHRFTLGDRVYGPPALREEGPRHGEGVTLAGLGLRPGMALGYQYDPRDAWEHDIAVEAVETARPAPAPACLDGARSAPPEGCGGALDYLELLAALRDRRHPRHDEALEVLGPDWDPEAFRLEAVNARLREWAQRSRANPVH